MPLNPFMLSRVRPCTYCGRGTEVDEIAYLARGFVVLCQHCIDEEKAALRLERVVQVCYAGWTPVCGPEVVLGGEMLATVEGKAAEGA